MMAEIPQIRPDVLMIESTYGVSIHEPRESRETRFTTTVHTIVGRGGRCLIPVFALGRAQELLLILGMILVISYYNLVYSSFTCGSIQKVIILVGMNIFNYEIVSLIIAVFLITTVHRIFSQ